MNSWFAVIVASISVFSWKMLGYLVPRKLLESKSLTKLSGYLTIGLLAGLVGVQTFSASSQKTSEHFLVIDERFAGLIVAAILLKLKAPFIVVVIVSAAVAAAIRLAF